MTLPRDFWPKITVSALIVKLFFFISHALEEAGNGLFLQI